MKFANDEFVGKLVLGRYRIVRVLAKGGMGVIYLARSEGAAGFVKPVVVKRILSEYVEDESMVGMFKREARIMSNLRHPGIVSVIDFGLDRNAYFMVLDYVHGFHLGRWQKFFKSARGPFPVEFAVHIVLLVLDALHYAHTLTSPDGVCLQIVHRDVTPSNVLMDVEGHVRLADFGIARMRTDATEVKTGETTIKGKFPYLAPEILHGASPSPLSDVYACGVVLHELISGKNEFRGADFSATVARVLEHRASSLELTRSDVPEGMDKIVAQAIEKDPAKRFQTAAEFAKSLREIRTETAEETHGKLAKAASRDFQDPKMAELLRADDLADLDRAWRDFENTAASAAPAAYTSTNPGSPESIPVNTETFVDPIPVAVEEQSENKRSPLPWVFAILLLGVIAAGGWLALQRLSPSEGTNNSPQYIVVQGGQDKQAANPDSSEEEAQQVAERNGSASVEPEEEQKQATPTVGQNRTKLPRSRPKQNKGSALSQAVRKKAGAFQRCFLQHVAEVDGSPTITIRFAIAPSGSVDQANISPAALAQTELGRCILSTAKSVEFGEQGEPLVFSIPIHTSVQ